MEQQDWTDAVKARANRMVAGKPCTACSKAFLLGDEVVTCPQCSSVSHSGCWAQHNGCAACAKAQPAEQAQNDFSVAAFASAASTEMIHCPMCAEEVPADAAECPYCGELMDDEQRKSLPRSFIVKAGSLVPDNVIMRIAGGRLNVMTAGGDMQASANRESVVLKKRKLIVVFDDRKHKYRIDDIGWVIVNHWLTGEYVRRTSVAAKDALHTAIAGILVFQVILPIFGIVYGIKAWRAIRRHPEHLTGTGYAIAAIVLSVLVLVGSWVLVIAAADRI